MSVPIADIKTLEESMRTHLKSAEDLRAPYQGKAESMTAEEEKAFDTHLDEVEKLKTQMAEASRDNRIEKAQEWARQPKEGGAPGLASVKEAAEALGTEIDDEGLEAANPELAKAMRSARTPEYQKALNVYLRSGGRTETLDPGVMKALSEGIDSDGGFLVPEDYRAELIRKVATAAQIRPRARTITTSRDKVTFPKVKWDTDDKWTSPVRLTWTGEKPTSETEAEVTDPVFSQESIPVHTAMASFPLYRDLIEDSAFDVLAYSTELLGEAYALGENESFIIGDSNGKPEGFMFPDGAEFPATVKSGDASTLKADGLIDLYYAVPVQYRSSASFYMNSQTAKVGRKLKDGQQRYLWDSMSAGGLLTRGDQDQLLGAPVVIDEFMPDLAANKTPIAFGDLRAYMIVDRIGLSIEVLREIKARENQIVLNARKRFGGQLLEPWRIRVQKIAA